MRLGKAGRPESKQWRATNFKATCGCVWAQAGPPASKQRRATNCKATCGCAWAQAGPPASKPGYIRATEGNQLQGNAGMRLGTGRCQPASRQSGKQSGRKNNNVTEGLLPL
eukprot:1107828-Pelagomonas_calceolata.AAC.1